MSKAVMECTQTDLCARFSTARRTTLALCASLTPEDMMVQSCPEASPAKWHIAHTTWFFESFVLRPFLSGYRLFNQDFPWLFNSYYESFSAIPEKRLRSSFSRPSLEEILRYREHVDEGIDQLFSANPDPEALRRILLGVNHEEQHQELLLTDIHHAFFTNPLRPAYLADDQPSWTASNGDRNPVPLRFQHFEGGLREFGYAGEDFAFDNESPRHRVWLEPYSLATRLITCGEYAAFMTDGGYNKPEFWLSAGWTAAKTNGWRAPLYWTNEDPQTSEAPDWSIFTLRGSLPLTKLANVPVSHISFYEADAYARWAGRRLPTEFEWEAVAEGQPVKGNLLDSGQLTPIACSGIGPNEDADQLWGDCWEWTASAYLGYPGFRPLQGSLGEYNGKFMSNQMILRGGSCVTPAAHIRASYRNFFSPETRWQFSGLRLAI